MHTATRDWSTFLKRKPAPVDAAALRSVLEGSTVLITGAGGFIGSALALAVATYRPAALVLLDIAEHGLHALQQGLAKQAHRDTALYFVTGDVCDRTLLDEVCLQHAPPLVLHAAACKHVWLMEHNPITSAHTNILGTDRVLQAASDAGAQQFLLLSTDKAVAPRSIMGATKSFAERLVVEHSGQPHQHMAAKAVRLGNVLGSTGSVVPMFAEQIAQGLPLSFTDARCTRYFLSIDECVGHLLAALLVPQTGLLVPACGEPFPVIALAEFLLHDSGVDPQHYPRLQHGLRPGEKLTEAMFAVDESRTATSDPVLTSAAISVTGSVADALAAIEACVRSRNVPALIATLQSALPDFVPSKLLARVTRAPETTPA